MLSAKAVSLSRGTEVVLDRVSLSIGPDSRIGIVGPNGIGKTTLLRVLAGLQRPDEGGVERMPASLSVGYLSQEDDAAEGETLGAYLARRTGVADAEAEFDRQTSALAEAPEDAGVLERYGGALERFLALGGDDFEARAAVVCDVVGLSGGTGLDVVVRQLSGGQGARARLAAILLARFDVFILDEPTNDLDFAGLARLESFLGSLAGGVAVVSHDRAFLDRVVDHILEIEEHHHRSTLYAGGWSEYVERRALARGQAGAAYESWVADRRRLSARICSQRAWSEEGVRKAAKRPKDNERLLRGNRISRTEKQASKVRISEQALERLGTLEKPWEGWQLHLDLEVRTRSGAVVARLDRAVVRRGSFTLGPVDLEIGWADRVAVMGPNGGGKSTLLAALIGEVELGSGGRYLGPGVVVGSLDQRRLSFSGGAFRGSASLLDAFTAATGVLPEEARNVLAKFGLSAAHVGRRPEALSPGERTRSQLAALMATGTNCLVLDEPTNHLDLPAIEQLEEALENFEGTLVVVSHDRWLLEAVSFDRTLEVRAGAVTEVGA